MAPVKCILFPGWPPLLSSLSGGSVAVGLLFNVLPIVCGSTVFVFVLLCFTLCPFKFCIYLEEEKKAGCFAVTVLQVYCYYKYSVTIPLQCVIVVFISLIILTHFLKFKLLFIL